MFPNNLHPPGAGILSYLCIPQIPKYKPPQYKPPYFFGEFFSNPNPAKLSEIFDFQIFFSKYFENCFVNLFFSYILICS